MLILSTTFTNMPIKQMENELEIMNIRLENVKEST